MFFQIYNDYLIHILCDLLNDKFDLMIICKWAFIYTFIILTKKSRFAMRITCTLSTDSFIANLVWWTFYKSASINTSIILTGKIIFAMRIASALYTYSLLADLTSTISKRSFINRLSLQNIHGHGDINNFLCRYLLLIYVHMEIELHYTY